MKKEIAAVTLISALVLGGGSSAYGAMSGKVANLVTTGAQMTGITYRYDPWPCNSSCYKGHSGFNYSGSLKDTKNDGNGIFVHAKIDGYGYASLIRNSKGAGKTISVSQKVYGADPAQRGKIQICRDRGALLPNNCAESPWIYRK